MRRSYYMSDDTRERPRPNGESELEAQQRDTCFVIEKRFNEAAEKFVELRKARLPCKIHFGSEAVTNIEELFKVRNLIYVMLLEAKIVPGQQFLN